MKTKCLHHDQNLDIRGEVTVTPFVVKFFCQKTRKKITLFIKHPEQTGFIKGRLESTAISLDAEKSFENGYQ